ncbi:hypothetical protein AcV7_002019 [Taiwanofungus camphoratus]|nr:hypothetical protein AcV7_002019 [Antrodia cinnamomea]
MLPAKLVSSRETDAYLIFMLRLVSPLCCRPLENGRGRPQQLTGIAKSGSNLWMAVIRNPRARATIRISWIVSGAFIGFSTRPGTNHCVKNGGSKGRTHYIQTRRKPSSGCKTSASFQHTPQRVVSDPSPALR